MMDLLIMAGGDLAKANEIGIQTLGYPGLWITHNSEIREILNTLKSKES